MSRTQPLGYTGRIRGHIDGILSRTWYRPKIFGSLSNLPSLMGLVIRLPARHIQVLPLLRLSGDREWSHWEGWSCSQGRGIQEQGIVFYVLPEFWQWYWVIGFRLSCRWPEWSWSQLKTWWGRPSCRKKLGWGVSDRNGRNPQAIASWGKFWYTQV